MNKRFFTIPNLMPVIGLMMLLLLFLLVTIQPVQAAYSVKKVFTRFSATAGEALATGNVVMIKDSDGYAYKADADDTALRPAVGVVGSRSASASGAVVEIVSCGILTGWTSLAEGGNAYLSATAAAVTQTAPSWVQKIGTAITTTEYFFSFNSLDADAITVLGVQQGASPIVLEGATADAYETTLAVADPTADRTITVPDYAGDVPIVVSQDSTQTSATNTTADVSGSSLTIADGWFGAGKTLKWTLYGTCAGANAVKNIILYIDDAAIVTLASEAADVGDWKAEFILHEHTAYATQDAMGVALMDNEAVIADYATDTTDFNDGGTTTVKCQVQSQHASDTITVEYVLVEFMN